MRVMFETGDGTLKRHARSGLGTSMDRRSAVELDGLCCEINRLLHNLIRNPKVEIPT